MNDIKYFICITGRAKHYQKRIEEEKWNRIRYNGDNKHEKLSLFVTLLFMSTSQS